MSPRSGPSSAPQSRRPSGETDVRDAPRFSLGGGVDRNQQVRMSAVGREYTLMRFKARVVQAHAEISTLVAFAEMAWAAVSSKHDDAAFLAEHPSARRLPKLDDQALELLHDQTLAWISRSNLAHSLNLHAGLELSDASCMTLRLRGMAGERVAASFSDDMYLLETLAGAMQLRGAVRVARRRLGPAGSPAAGEAEVDAEPSAEEERSGAKDYSESTFLADNDG